MLAQRYWHGGHPIARWMFANTAIKEDANENIRPDKEGSNDNITGIVGAVMALCRATVHPTEDLEEAVW
jgi:phage terminase large subunit-like protein